MSRVPAATGMDRLPWLPDEPASHKPPRRSAGAIGVAMIAVLAVGGAAAWFGAHSIEQSAPPRSAPPRAVAKVRLPAARPAEPSQPQVKIAPLPEVEPIVAPPMPVIQPPPEVTRTPAKVIASPAAAEPQPSVTEPPAKRATSAKLEPWPVRVIEGAAGRLVRVGAFSSVHQAKRGWWAIVRVNPTLERLPALVVPVQSLRDGRIYYRLQMGTTSQAHSAVLCQRMRMIAQPCVVIGAA